MSIPAKCSHCGESYNLNDTMVGKTVRCKGCQETFVVARANGAAAKPAAASAVQAGRAPAKPPVRARIVEDDEEEDALPAGGGKKTPQKSSTGKIVLLVGGIVTAVLLLCCVLPVGAWLVFVVGLAGKVTSDINSMQAEMMTSREDIDKAIDKAMKDQGFGPGGMPGNPGPGKQPGDPGPGKQPGDPGPGKQPAGPGPDKTPGFVVGRDPTSIDEALQFLKGSDVVQRQKAANWLAKTPVDNARQAEVAQALDSLLASRDASRSVTDVPVTSALSVWATDDSVPVLVKFLDAGTLNDPNPAVHECERNAMEAIAKLHAEAGANAIARYLTHAFAPHDDAMRALQTFGPKAEPAAVKYYFVGTQNAKERARRLCKEYGTKDGTIALVAAEDLKNEDVFRRQEAADWLINVGKPDPMTQALVAKALEAVVTSEADDNIKERAARALATWATPDQSPSLIKLIDSRSDNVRRAAMKSLGRLKEEKAILPITLRLPDFGDRATASQALQDIGPKAEVTVATGLTNNDKGVRLEVCRILGVIGSTKDTLKALDKAAKIATANKDIEMLQACANAAQMIKSRM